MQIVKKENLSVSLDSNLVETLAVKLIEYGYAVQNAVDRIRAAFKEVTLIDFLGEFAYEQDIKDIFAQIHDRFGTHEAANTSLQGDVSRLQTGFHNLDRQVNQNQLRLETQNNYKNLETRLQNTDGRLDQLRQETQTNTNCMEDKIIALQSELQAQKAELQDQKAELQAQMTRQKADWTRSMLFHLPGYNAKLRLRPYDTQANIHAREINGLSLTFPRAVAAGQEWGECFRGVDARGFPPGLLESLFQKGF